MGSFAVINSDNLKSSLNHNFNISMENKIAKTLLTPIKLGDLTLPNKAVMASMSRLRADPVIGAPNDLHVEYYAQRASAGLILSEGILISKGATGYLGAGNLYTQEHIDGWKKVTDAVHEKGGRIFAQLAHMGRASHQEYSGEQPLAPSPLRIRHTPQVGLDYEVPKEMTKDDIQKVLEEFKTAAQNAKKAGFDGVEAHGASGFLIDQFLADGTNHRTDEYGGTPENRARFPLEVIDTFISVFGKGRVGIKLSPVCRYNDWYDSDPVATYSYLLKELDKKGIAYVQILEPESNAYGNEHGPGNKQIQETAKTFRPYFKGLLMANFNLTPETATTFINEGVADLVSFGRHFIANPDFIERIRNQWPYNEGDASTFYGGGAKGYIDYPFYETK